MLRRSRCVQILTRSDLLFIGNVYGILFRCKSGTLTVQCVLCLKKNQKVEGAEKLETKKLNASKSSRPSFKTY